MQRRSWEPLKARRKQKTSAFAEVSVAKTLSYFLGGYAYQTLSYPLNTQVYPAGGGGGIGSMGSYQKSTVPFLLIFCIPSAATVEAKHKVPASAANAKKYRFMSSSP